MLLTHQTQCLATGWSDIFSASPVLSCYRHTSSHLYLTKVIVTLRVLLFGETILWPACFNKSTHPSNFASENVATGYLSWECYTIWFLGKYIPSFITLQVTRKLFKTGLWKIPRYCFKTAKWGVLSQSKESTAILNLTTYRGPEAFCYPFGKRKR